jgi:hypothetical protein
VGLAGGIGAITIGATLEALKVLNNRLPFNIYLPLWTACSLLLVLAIVLFRKVAPDSTVGTRGLLVGLIGRIRKSRRLTNESDYS